MKFLWVLSINIFVLDTFWRKSVFAGASSNLTPIQADIVFIPSKIDNKNNLINFTI